MNAPNGTIKSSLAKTFEAVRDNRPVEDVRTRLAKKQIVAKRHMEQKNVLHVPFYF